MIKKGFGYNLSTGLKGLIVGILTMLIMILPAWLIKWIWTMENMLAVTAILGLVWILFYLVVWGWSWNWISKFWK
jgi:flagellar biosynthesis component FlhA